METIFTSHGYKAPYKVTLANGIATIEKEHILFRNETVTKSYKPCMAIPYETYFVDNNSVLLAEAAGTYVFIGMNIIRWTPRSQIVSFVSNIGNRNVAYPYAVDSQKNVYLLIESTIIYDNEVTLTDPYNYYYHNIRISANMVFDITGVDVTDGTDTRTYSMTYQSDPASHFSDFYEDNWDKIVLKKFNKPDEILTKETYVKIHEDFGKIMKFAPLGETVLHNEEYE